MLDGCCVCFSGVEGCETVVAWEGRTALDFEALKGGRVVLEEEGLRVSLKSGVDGTRSSDVGNWVEDAMSLRIWAVICCDTVMLPGGVELGS